MGLPQLYKRSKSGRIQKWNVVLMHEDDVPVIVRSSGLLNGKTQTKKRLVKKGTNIGKANENSPTEHAIFLMNKMHTDKIEENFVADVGTVDHAPLYWYPMSAQKFNEKRADWKNAYAQPKLNGIRSWQPRHMQEHELTVRDAIPTAMLSRKMHRMDHIIDHINDVCNDVFGDVSPDGEVFKFGQPLGDIQSWTSKFYKETHSLQYWIYDLAIPGVKYKERKRIIQELVPADHPIIKIVPTFPVKSFKQFKYLHDRWYLKGYEGAMYRDGESEYAFNERPFSLMKYKHFVDDEFLCVGHEIEEYHDQKTNEIWQLVIWVCECDNGERFTVRPTGKMEKRKIEIVDVDAAINQQYTVRYQELSEDKIPIFPTGREFRKAENW